MQIKNSIIVNAFTDLDEMMRHGNGPIMLLTPLQMFEMGQFYEWSKAIVEDDNCDLDAMTLVPEDFAWVVGETQGW